MYSAKFKSKNSKIKKPDSTMVNIDFTNDNISSKCGCGTSVNFK